MFADRKWKETVEANNICSRINVSKVIEGNLQFGRTGLMYIKRRTRFNNAKQENLEFWEVIKKA